jgi:arginase
MDLGEIRRTGLARALDEAIAHVTRPELDGFWIHFDADVLDPAIMPAVKYHLPDGFSWDEIALALRTALASDQAVGLEVTIYDPTLDPSHRGARGLVDAIARGFTR